MNAFPLASLSSQFTAVDWAIVGGYLVLTTWLGTALAGRQASIRDFFLGGRKLPWYAVSGSIIATEISAVTFVIVPFIVFRPGGNFTYLQLGVFGSLLARVLVGYVLVPAYYEREIYSPYDYMGNRLGGHVRSMTTALFALGGMLAQSARVYLTAEILVVVLHDQLLRLSEAVGLYPLAWAIIVIAIVAIAWTLIGGITTVIWTDAILFLVFLIGAVVALGTVAFELPGGLAEMFRVGWEAKESGPWGKFTFFDFSPSPVRAYTIWTAVIAATWGGLGAYGTDQLIAQRMFCCKGPREARWAIISSTVSQLVTITVALVGVGLYAYYQQTPEPTTATQTATAAVAPGDFPLLRGEARQLYEQNGNRIFPIFIVEAIPVGLKGLIIAGVFAAAVSSLTSILAALSQTVMSAFYLPLRERRRRRGGATHAPGDEERHSVFIGRLLVLFWGVVLAAMAFLAQLASEFYPSILDLALAMAGYAGGALLAGFALAFLPLRIDGRGFMYSGPLSVLCVFALVWHQPWTHWVCLAGAAVLLAAWVVVQVWRTHREPSGDQSAAPASVLPCWLQTLLLVTGVALMLWLNYFGYWEGPPRPDGHTSILTIAWPWYAPIGSTVAFVLGWLLAGRPAGTAAGALEPVPGR